jgi:hypothetical protein
MIQIHIYPGDEIDKNRLGIECTMGVSFTKILGMQLKYINIAGKNNSTNQFDATLSFKF